MYKRIKEHVHFIGIGGIGMSGIAEVLVRQGYPISGSDLSESEATRKLSDLGVKVYFGHQAAHLAGAEVVVYSSAIGRENPEYLEAQKQGLPLVPRAEMLAELMRLKYGVAIAGTHGKTTTTSMLASILAHAQQDPTIIVGGKVDALGGNAKLGQGRCLIAEADESDGSFLKLSPVLTIITNIDNDHLDYYGQMERLRMSFLEFANKVPYYGRTIVCCDDLEVNKIIPLIAKPHLTYGFANSAHFRIDNYLARSTGSEFDLFQNNTKIAHLELKVPGQHNARNAVAALVAALELDIELGQAVEALKLFQGVRRRFEVKGQWNNVLIVDDYGHHPTEIQATIEATRSYKDKRVVVAFQPHRYSRTQICWDQFATALQSADQVYLLDIYPAGESPIAGVDSETLCNHLKNYLEHCEYIGSIQSAHQVLQKKLAPGDLLITLGAGSITQLSSLFLGS